MRWDQIINNEHIQKCLLTESNLDYKNAIEIAQALESAQLTSEQLASKSSFKETSGTLQNTVHKMEPFRVPPRKAQACL